MQPLKKQTDKQTAKLVRENTIYLDFCKHDKPGQSRVELVKYLMEKHDIGSASTIYAIIKRAEKRFSKPISD